MRCAILLSCISTGLAVVAEVLPGPFLHYASRDLDHSPLHRRAPPKDTSRDFEGSPSPPQKTPNPSSSRKSPERSHSMTSPEHQLQISDTSEASRRAASQGPSMSAPGFGQYRYQQRNAAQPHTSGIATGRNTATAAGQGSSQGRVMSSGQSLGASINSEVPRQELAASRRPGVEASLRSQLPDHHRAVQGSLDGSQSSDPENSERQRRQRGATQELAAEAPTRQYAQRREGNNRLREVSSSEPRPRQPFHGPII